MPALNMDLQVGGTHTVIRLRGDIDSAAARDIVAVVEVATARPTLQCVVLDLSGVRFLGATGVEAVQQIRELCVRRDIQIEVQTHNPAVRDALVRSRTMSGSLPGSLAESLHPHTSEPDGTAAGLTPNRELRLAQ